MYFHILNQIILLLNLYLIMIVITMISVIIMEYHPIIIYRTTLKNWNDYSLKYINKIFLEN